MKLQQALRQIARKENLNFLLTNRIPRIALTRAVGWISKIRQPAIRSVLIGLWKLFTDLDLSDAARTRFDSLHDCFTRELKPGARTIDRAPDVMVSPCDGIVGACGEVRQGQLFQAKGFPYPLADLMGSASQAARFVDGCYVTLRLTSAMYHRFHALHDMLLERVDHISGDTWNVNPIALKRVERLFCKNERAVLHVRLAVGGHRVARVPVAAILVASIRLHCVNVLLHLRYRGPNRIDCDARAVKGQELGWFEHGSTIIVLAPCGFDLCAGIAPGVRIAMGSALMRVPDGARAGHELPAVISPTPN